MSTIELSQPEVKTSQALWGGLIALLTLALGAALLKDSTLFLRLVLGLSLGFALTKASIGFAGSVNRAYRRGSTQLLRTLMLLFVITAIFNAGLLYKSGPAGFDLWVNPINLGLIIGGVMFGAGMCLSSCCASGVMVEMVSDIPRALTTLFFFGFGVFIGFPLQATAPWITESLFHSSSFANGVYLPDLFAFGPLNGYLSAVIVTVVLAVIVNHFAKRYEQAKRNDGSYLGVDGELQREKLTAQPRPLNTALFSRATYQIWFAEMWTLRQGAFVIAIIFAIMMATTGAGWGASTPFGIWFGKFLMLFGVSSQTLAEFSHRPAALFELAFFEHQISVQNLAILVGTLIAVLLMGRFSHPFNTRHSAKQFALFALGGALMGVGTRLANGCNVGALYTPIANFSLSGWVFLIFLIIGGVLGNKFAQLVNR
ncbi:YeeE/YedE family protein [Shewanella sp. AS1]|uniref:YeeE/YedE family protein n=1 Tax=Shewanella sp. AS1 TaxID=2907626 RepID=UPI001F346436|nr:YeeE/YedE family protein [Shewanella sp. AS1]MCE9680602.1 YeeE/YedE family protein [Shewanella sp. AS1]